MTAGRVVRVEVVPVEFARIQSELERLLELASAVSLGRLISVGSDRAGEHHWRLKTPSGQVIMVRIEVER